MSEMDEADKLISFERVQREAETLRAMLDKGEGDTDALYAAYNALLMALGYGVKPPSEMWKDAPEPSAPPAQAMDEEAEGRLLMESYNKLSAQTCGCEYCEWIRNARNYIERRIGRTQ